MRLQSIFACQQTNKEPTSDVKASVGLHEDLNFSEAADGDIALEVKGDETIPSFKVTSINPVDGVNKLDNEELNTFCSRLNFAGENDWRMISKNEAQYLFEKDINLIPKYSNTSYWAYQSLEDAHKELVRVHRHCVDSANEARGINTQFVASMCISLATGLQPNLDTINNTIQRLAHKVEAGEGEEIYTYHFVDNASKNTTDLFSLARHVNKKQDVICAKN